MTENTLPDDLTFHPETGVPISDGQAYKNHSEWWEAINRLRKVNLQLIEEQKDLPLPQFKRARHWGGRVERA